MTAREILAQKKDTFPFEGKWHDAFGNPERTGTWFIWGESSNGKSSFVMQLCKELAKYDRVLFNSLEEGACLTMQQSIQRHKLEDVGRNFHLLPGESIDKLSARLRKRKSPNIIVIDSFQYTMMNYKDYIRLKETHRDKLFIFTSHAEGKDPCGSAAKRVKYDASLKIRVEGFKALCAGRTVGKSGEFIIWEEGAERYWSQKMKSKSTPKSESESE